MRSQAFSRHFALPAYCVAGLLVVIPLVDTAVMTLPFQPGEVRWRFGAAGLFSRALMTPLLGLLLAHGTALLLEQRRVLRVTSVLSGLTAVALVAVAVLFTLDAVQMRASVVPGAQRGFDVATVVALGKFFLGTAVLLVFAIVAWKAARTRGEAAAEPGRVIVGSRQHPAASAL